MSVRPFLTPFVFAAAIAFFFTSFASASDELETPSAQADTPFEKVPPYDGPCALEFLDDSTLLLLHSDGRRLDWFSLPERKLLYSLSLPQQPHCMILPKGENKRFAYISTGWEKGEVLEIDLNSRSIKRSWNAIHTPWAMAEANKAGKLYVGRRFHNDILVLDLKSGEWEPGSIPVLREPMAMVMTPEENALYVGNALPDVPANGSVVSTAVSRINLADKSVRHLRMADGATAIRSMTISPDGNWVLLVHNMASHRSVTTQLAGGWTSRNGLSLINISVDSSPVTYLIDDNILGLPNPWTVKFSPDGRLIAITIAGSREVAFISTEELVRQVLRDTNGLKFNQSFYFGVGSFTSTLKRVQIPEVIGPRALAMNNKYTVAAGYFSDNLAVFNRISEESPNEAKTSDSANLTTSRLTSFQPEIVNWGKKPVLNAIRRGEILFHDGEASLENWHSCATCHPDARADGMNWDLLNDGTGNHKSTKSMLFSHKTPPCMALGVRENAEAAVKAGFVHIHFIPRPEQDYLDVDEYLKALVPVPGPRILPTGELSESARRGKRLFHSRKTGCAVCHNGPYLTDGKMHDVGTESEYDFGENEFDTPSLIEIHRTGPYLHDGRYTTLEELLFGHFHGDKDGARLKALSPQEKDDLIEYLLSL